MYASHVFIFKVCCAAFLEFIEIIEPALSLGSGTNFISSGLKLRFDILIISSICHCEDVFFFFIHLTNILIKKFSHENKLF